MRRVSETDRGWHNLLWLGILAHGRMFERESSNLMICFFTKTLDKKEDWEPTQVWCKVKMQISWNSSERWFFKVPSPTRQAPMQTLRKERCKKYIMESSRKLLLGAPPDV